MQINNKIIFTKVTHRVYEGKDYAIVEAIDVEGDYIKLSVYDKKILDFLKSEKFKTMTEYNVILIIRYNQAKNSYSLALDDIKIN